MAVETLLSAFLDRVKTDAARPALVHKARSVDWKILTWGEWGELALKVARGFIAQGLQPGHSVAILGEGRQEWAVCYMGALLAGGRPVGLYPTATSEMVGHIVSHSDAAIIVAENKLQFDKLRSAMARMPNLQSIIVMEGAGNNHDLLSWEQLLARGEGFPMTPLNVRIAEADLDQAAALVYAFGAGPLPRPVELRQGAMLAAARGLGQAIGAGRDDVHLAHTPLAHVTAQVLNLWVPVLFGGAVWFSKGGADLVADLRDCRPTVFFAVPEVWERLYIDVQARLGKPGGVGSRVLRFAAQTADATQALVEQGARVPAGLKVKQQVGESLVYLRMKTDLGLERAEHLLSGTAPLPPSLLTGFRHLGMSIYELYGLAECAGIATINVPGAARAGTCGKPIDGVEIRLADDGEILLAGPTLFSGYLDDPRASADALAGGWLHTGDLGVVDDAGFLKVFDRKEDVIELKSGDRVAPSLLELQLKAVPEVSRAVVVGEGQRHIALLLTIHPDLGMKWVRDREINVVSMRELAGNMSFNSYIRAQVDAVNEGQPPQDAIKAFKILEKDLSEADGELSPSHKVRRQVVASRYEALIRKLYGDEWEGDDGAAKGRALPAPADARPGPRRLAAPQA